MEQANTDLVLLLESNWAILHMANTITTTRCEIARAAAQGAFEPRSLFALLEANHRLINALGDILNGMDAVTEDDAWLDPIFKAVRERCQVPRPGGEVKSV